MITYLLKLNRESRTFSFYHNFAQKQILKLHKFLLGNLKGYAVEYPLDYLEVKMNTLTSAPDGSSTKALPLRNNRLDAGTIAMKGQQNQIQDEYTFMYVLAKPDETMVKAKKDKFASESDMNAVLQSHTTSLYGYVDSFLPSSMPPSTL